MITVIIPTYKRNDNLTRAIESVLNQTGSFEVIVVDDNDPDTIYRNNNEKTLLKYKKYNNFYYYKHSENKNGAAARNTGIKYAHGDFITFLDDDDVFLPNRIKKIEEITSNDDYDLIVTGFNIIKNDKCIGEYYPKIIEKKDMIIDLLKQKSFFGTGSNLVCKASIIKRISGFDDSFIRHQDIEFAIRFLENSNKIYSINEVLVSKYVDDRRNLPTFEKMVNIKSHFLKKFDYIINSLPLKEKKKIIICNYYELLGTAYAKNDKEEIKLCRNFLKENKIYYPTKEFIIFMKTYIKKNHIAYSILKRLKK